MARRRRGSLSDDDLDHWRRVARTARPLSRDAAGAPADAEPHDAPQASRRSDAMPDGDGQPERSHPMRSTAIPEFRVGQAARAEANGHDLRAPIGARLSQQPLHMDARIFGRLKKGKLLPDRKLDLHGMTLAQAHPTLLRFVQHAHADGLRLLLVVTGKGRSGADEGLPVPAPRGVLRHQVPQWLTSAGMRPFVLQVTDAHRRHGGTGAYYVYLRRPR